MKRYKKLKTSDGHKYLVRLSDQEIAANRKYWIAVTVIPFVASAAMFFLWVKCG